MKNARILVFVVVLVLAVAVFAIVVALPSLTTPQGAAQTIDAGDDVEKAVVLRLINEGFHEGNSDVVSEIYAQDYIGHIPANPIIDSTIDVNKMSELIELLGSAIPDLQIEAQLVVQEDNMVATRVVIRGNFLSEFYDVPPTESSVEFAVNVFHRFNDVGKIAEEWIEFDTWDVMQQMGIDPLAS